MKYAYMIFTSILLFLGMQNIDAQFKVRNDQYIQIGYDSYKSLTFGIESNSPNNGKYAIEHWNGGFNFWKPWPTPYFGNYILFLRDDKNVGIGSSGSSSYMLDISGTARSWGWYTTSDRRLKSNIQNIENALDKILQLNGVSYQYKFEFSKYSDLNEFELDAVKKNTIKFDNKIIADKKQRIGFIAQDVQNIVPEAVKEDEKGFLSINYSEIIPLLVESIKEQEVKINKLEDIINEMQNSKQKIEQRDDGTNKILPKSKTFLLNNYPDPFSSFTKIQYFVSDDDINSNVSIKIFNQSGRLIKIIPINKTLGKGEIEISKDKIGKGIFIYSLFVGGVVKDSKTMICTQ